MNELPLGINIINIGIYILLFTLLFLLLKKFLAPAIEKMFATRQELIKRSLEDSQKATLELEDAGKKSEVILNEARNEAEQAKEKTVEVARNEAKDIVNKANIEAKTIVENAKEKIESDMKKKRTSINAEVEQKVKQVIEKMLESGEISTDSKRITEIIEKL